MKNPFTNRGCIAGMSDTLSTKKGLLNNEQPLVVSDEFPSSKLTANVLIFLFEPNFVGWRSGEKSK